MHVIWHACLLHNGVILILISEEIFRFYGTFFAGPQNETHFIQALKKEQNHLHFWIVILSILTDGSYYIGMLVYYPRY